MVRRARRASFSPKAGVAARRELGRNEQRDDAAGTSELEGPFGECDREVRQMRESSSGSWSPAGVATREGLPHARCQPFGADPRRIADHEVEPAAVDHLSEVGLEREKRSRALL